MFSYGTACSLIFCSSAELSVSSVVTNLFIFVWIKSCDKNLVFMRKPYSYKESFNVVTLN